ncbi:MAG: CoA transferase [Acidimicrobiia bacterium]|nr:CoA transferase [Acidimicrobiia bacterium]
MSGALADVRVIEFAQVVAVPVGGALLAGLGAEVIKVEPLAGDASRLVRPTGSKGQGRLFIVHNRGKKSVGLDLTHERAREVIEPLVASADVVTTGFKRADLPRYGLTYGELSAIKPDLVYVESTPYGPAGPMADLGGYDPVAMGLSGVAFQAASELRGAPKTMVPAFADFGTGFLTALGVVAALRHRDLTGEGQKVETSLLATAMVYSSQSSNWIERLDNDRADRLAVQLAAAQTEGAPFAEQQALWWRSFRPDNHANATFRYYRCVDGFISVACLSPGLVARFHRALEVSDPRHRDGWDPRAPGADEELIDWVTSIESTFAKQPCEFWLRHLTEHGVPCGRVNTSEQAVDDPQVVANGYLSDFDQPGLGPMRSYDSPVRLSGSPTPPLGPAPAVGADTGDLLADLGLGAEHVADLRLAGVIA